LWGTATDGREEKMHWEHYVRVNQKFVDTVVEIYKPGDLGLLEL
jgi:trehalose 6-phosphate synthase/phosphatase